MSGGMEKQTLNVKVNPVIKSLTDQPVDTEQTVRTECSMNRYVNYIDLTNNLTWLYCI